MAITRILLKNFKCFQEVEVNLAKITLLTGGNSSGKSSLMYGLLAALQSKQFPFYLSPNGKYVNMGDFEEISFNHKRDNPLEIDITVDDFFGGLGFSKTTWVIDADNRLPKLKDLTIKSDDLDFEIRLDNEYIANFKLEFQGANIKLTDLKAHTLEELDRKFYNANNDYRDIFGYTEIFERIDHNLNYISSFRLEPERTYYQKTKPEDKVGRAGEGYIDQILEWEGQKAVEFKQLKSILKDLKLLNTITSRKLPGGRFEVRVKVKNKGVWASLTDVGFGISQFLPIIVADLQLSQESTLLLAQPEIHLHPSVQASLADYFVKQIRESNKRYIIETHSEYLLNRIRLAIVKGEIEPSDVSIYYFENSINGSQSYQIEFRKNGQIDNAPKGFFETYMMDVMDIALHAEG